MVLGVVALGLLAFVAGHTTLVPLRYAFPTGALVATSAMAEGLFRHPPTDHPQTDHSRTE